MSEQGLIHLVQILVGAVVTVVSAIWSHKALARRLDAKLDAQPHRAEHAKVDMRLSVLEQAHGGIPQ